MLSLSGFEPKTYKVKTCRCLEIPTHPNCEQHLVCSKVSKIETKVVLKLTAKSVTFTFFRARQVRQEEMENHKSKRRPT